MKPELLRWALKRADMTEEDYPSRLPLASWLSGAERPTVRQLEEFARRTHAPYGYLLLDEPPEEGLPVADFRAISRNKEMQDISVNLRDTLHKCLLRQDWYRENQLYWGHDPSPLFESESISTPPLVAATRLRTTLAWSTDSRSKVKNSAEAIRWLRSHIEAHGALVMISGVVGSNTQRPLDVDEFRGFALADALASLIFVNGADAKSAQLFTLLHELAHISIGLSGISDTAFHNERVTERWCNAVAAEFLVPRSEFSLAVGQKNNLKSDRTQWTELGRQFHVSSQVILIRLRELGILTAGELAERLREERLLGSNQTNKKSSGGNPYRNVKTRTGKRFAEEMVVSVLEGRTTYREAFRLLDIGNLSMFRRLAIDLQIIPEVTGEVGQKG